MWYNKISGCPDPERTLPSFIITYSSHLVKSFFQKKCTNFGIKILKNLCIFSLDKMSQLCYNGRLGSRAGYYNTFSATCQPLFKKFFIFVILHKNKIQHFAQKNKSLIYLDFCYKNFSTYD